MADYYFRTHFLFRKRLNVATVDIFNLQNVATVAMGGGSGRMGGGRGEEGGEWGIIMGLGATREKEGVAKARPTASAPAPRPRVTAGLPLCVRYPPHPHGHF